MIQNITKLLAFGSLGMIAVFLTCCMDLGKSQDAALAIGPISNSEQLSMTGANGFSVFQNTFYPFATANCAACHTSSGSAPYPFADSDVNLAYNTALTLANFTSPYDAATSIFVTEVGDTGTQMCGSNCSTISSMIENALQPWADAELAATTGPAPTGSPTAPAVDVPIPTYLSTALAVPALIPTLGVVSASPTPKVVAMRWNLSNLTPPSALVNGAYFEVQIEYQGTDMVAYRIFDPRIEGLAAPVQIQGIHLLVDSVGEPGPGAEYPTGGLWDADDLTAAVFKLPTPLPTPTFTSTILDARAQPLQVVSGTPEITIGFDSIAVPSPSPSPMPSPSASPTLGPSYSSLNTFIFTPMCVNCHSATTQSGGINLSTYTGVLGAINSKTPSACTLYQSVTTPTSGVVMPDGGTPLNAAELSALSTWISNGYPDD